MGIEQVIVDVVAAMDIDTATTCGINDLIRHHGEHLLRLDLPVDGPG